MDTAYSSSELNPRAWCELLVREHEKRVELQFQANKEAIAIASQALTIRLEHANGLIEQMRRQGTELARSTELTAAERRIEALERHQSSAEGVEKGGKIMRDIGMLIIGAVIAYVLTLLST